MFKNKTKKADKRKIREIESWIYSRGGMVYLTELVVKCHGWTCECCGSDRDLDAYMLEDKEEKNADGFRILNHTNENLICLCPHCYKKYGENAVSALRHMTNPQVFKPPMKDPRIEKFCR